jgi:2-phosphosulfolactate phosphatase
LREEIVFYLSLQIDFVSMPENKKKVEVCFSPALYPEFRNNESIVVIVDILRATSAIVTAFMNGVRSIIPVATLEEAKAYKQKGYLVAAERDGLVRDFADFGNSPYNFKSEVIAGQDIVYSTTNGTQSIMMAADSHKVIIGAYLNIDAICNYIFQKNRDVVILCAGWKNKFNIEDTLFAGALAQKILLNPKFHTVCDATHVSIDLWNLAKGNLLEYLEKAAQRHRLKKNNLDDVIEYCHKQNLTTFIPVLEGKNLVAG